MSIQRIARITHYYYAQAVFHRDGEAWSAYRTAMFDHLQSSQNKDGSWPAGDGISVGPVYATALWCIVLQLDKRSHPSRRPPERKGAKKDGRNLSNPNNL